MVQGRRQGRKLLLLLDYDGTLVEIAPRPELATPTPGLLRQLAHLINRLDYAVVVVSEGLSFKVGDAEQPTKATHFLTNPAQVGEFLALLATQREEKS